MTAREFDAASLIVRKRCRFFPLMADILDAVQEVRRSPTTSITPTTPMIEDVTSNHDLTPEELERNKARVRAIRDMLAGKITMEDALGKVVECAHISDFSTMARI